MRSALLLAVVVLGPTRLVAAQPGYPGVVPGGGQPPAVERLEHRHGARARAAILTWPGFSMLPDGGSRFFVQTTEPVPTELRVGADRVEVIFRRTTVHLANSRRWLETQFFNTPVVRARLERRGHDMVLVLHLRAASRPRMSDASGDGPFHYVYVDFDRGDFLPAEPPPPPPGSLSTVTAHEPAGAPPPPPPRPVHDPLDDERPPPIGPMP